MPDKPTFDDYFAVVYDVLKQYENLNVIIEPGMSVVGAGIDYVTSVVDVKQTLNNQFAVLDGSRIHIDPIKRKNAYTYEIVHTSTHDTQIQNDRETILCGFTCMEDDRFFSLEDSQVSVGDRVVFLKVGKGRPASSERQANDKGRCRCPDHRGLCKSRHRRG